MGFHAVPSMNHLHMHVISKVCNRMLRRSICLCEHRHVAIACDVCMCTHVGAFLGAAHVPSSLPQDFVSPKLKHKQHWNSFTTSFFVPLEKVLTDLEARDAVEVDRARAEALLKQPLRCHHCQEVMKNMPDLKSHIVACMVRS